MAITSGFFNAQVDGQGNYDRAGTAEQFAKYFSQFISNGIFMKSSDKLQVFANSGMSITVKAGYAWINGYWVDVDTDASLSLSASPTTGSRIDRVVLRLDLTLQGRAITLAVKNGTAAVSPVAPSLTRNNEVYELALADIVVGKNVASIVQANITDTRLDTELCGIVTGLIDQVNTSTLYLQIQNDLANFQNVSEADFNAWLVSIQGILDEDTAGHLLTMIENLKTEVENHPWVELTPSSGAITLNTTNGSRFHVSQSADLTVNITAKDGDAFCLIVDVETTNAQLILPDNVELIGELEQTSGLTHVINFIRYDDAIMAYVLGKAD